MKNNRILLSENEVAATELIQYHQLKAANGKTLLSKLDKMGLTFECVDNWDQVIEALTKDYPNAKLLFNLQAAGIEDQYNEAEAFYQKNYSVLSFEPLTDQQIEAIKESSRVYADQPNQIEAYNLFQSIVNNAKRLKELGVRMELEELYKVNICLQGGNRYQELSLSQKELTATLMKLK